LRAPPSPSAALVCGLADANPDRALDGFGGEIVSLRQLPNHHRVELKNSLPVLLPRFLALLLFWLILDGTKPAGLVIGLPSAALAAWLSVRLAPPFGGRLSPVGLFAFCVHFLWGSLVAGVDVAIRAFRPRLPLRAGFVACPCGIAPGPRRDLFLAACSLMPGSLPVEEGVDGRVILHALDVEQAHAEQMAENEVRLARAMGRGPTDA
jgi:multicomponent Na+:H+ antiporter subunit E